jgi:predicted metal-dependent peptidase
MKKGSTKKKPPASEKAKADAPPSAADIADAASKLEQAAIALLRQEPFYAHLLTSLRRVYSTEVPTAAVSATGRGATLWVNPLFFLKQISERERIGVLKHELLHLMFKHPWRETSNMPDDGLRNIAADLVVNQFVAPFPLPKGAIVLGSFPDLTPDQTMEWYYKKLRELDSSPDPKATAALEKAFETSKAQGCSAKWHEKGNEDGDGDGADDATADSGASSGEDSNNGSGAARAPIHGIGDLGEAIVRGLVARAKAKTNLKEWGNLPLGVQQMVNELCSPPKNPWKRLLRLFAGRGSRTVIRSTRLRESTRFPGQPGTKVKRLHRIVVAVDTSGSIGPEVLSEFLNEINGIARSGADITLIECDCQIHNVVPYHRRMKPEFKGGGGTDFNPVMQWLRDNVRKNIGGCIYLTDGCAASPTIDPRCKVLWVITPGMEVRQGWNTLGK